MKSLRLISLVLVALASPIFAAASDDELAQYHQYHLTNGLKLIVKEDHRAPVVLSQVWYKVGSGMEPGGITGISHMLEHMMFKGTQRYKTGEFSKIIAANGGEENAMTSNDYTSYYQELEASRLPLSFELEADRMHNLLLTEQEFNKEIEVVKEERRMRVDDNPEAATFERLLAVAHSTPPYQHMTIGTMDDLNNLKVADVKAWYAKWYAPNNAVVVVVGDVKPEQVYELAKKYFGDIPRGQDVPIKPQRERLDPGERSLVVQLPAKIPALIMAYNTPTLRNVEKKSDAYALDVLSGLLAGGASSRLQQDLVRDKQIASAVATNYDLYNRFDGLFFIEANPAQDKSIEEVQSKVLAHIKRLQTELVSLDELNRVKAQVVANKTFARDSLSGQNMQIGALECVGLSWRDGENYAQNIRTITPQQVKDAANRYLTGSHLTTAVLSPLPMSADSAINSPSNVGVTHVH